MKSSCILQGKIRCCHLINNSFWAHDVMEAFFLLVARGQKGRSYGRPPEVWHQFEVSWKWASHCVRASHRVCCCSPPPRPLLQPLDLLCLSSLTVCLTLLIPASSYLWLSDPLSKYHIKLCSPARLKCVIVLPAIKVVMSASEPGELGQGKVGSNQLLFYQCEPYWKTSWKQCAFSESSAAVAVSKLRVLLS